MPRTTRRLSILLLLAGLLAGCSGGAAPDGDDPPRPSESSTQARQGHPPIPVVTGLSAPWSVAFVGDVPVVSERDSARVLEITAEGKSREVGTIDGVEPAGEGGQLGLAVDDEHRLYVYSTADDGNRIQRYDLTGEPGSFRLGPMTTLVEGIPVAANHNGGRLALGPDGMLYAATGDAGSPALAQDLGSPAGKILRMTRDGEVPADNPFPGSLVYSIGHRNVQGLAWANDGTMFATEFGQNTWDELNVVEAGGNYGWPEVEGRAGADGFVDPVQQWRPSEASPSGLAHLDGTLYVANLGGEVLRAVPVADPATSTVVVDDQGRLRDAVVSPDGHLWVLTNNTDGRGTPREGDDQVLRYTPAPE